MKDYILSSFTCNLFVCLMSVDNNSVSQVYRSAGMVKKKGPYAKHPYHGLIGVFYVLYVFP